MTARAPDLPYVPALDGVRGLAVLAVLLYHAQVSWSRGGFLGVDLFFVLSGYLITGLLLDERARTGGIDLVRFWGRRARRLLPALFLVLVAVSGYAALLARPTQRESLRLDALSTLGYVANWRFALTHQSYFAQYDDPSPLRHMWSLGIEEQFYVVFPLLIVALVALAAGRTRLLTVVLVAGTVLSAVEMLAVFDPSADPSRVYYGTDTRAQALLVGALLAVWAVRQPAGQRRPTYLRVGPVEVPMPGAALLAAASLASFLVLAFLARDLSPWLYRGGFLLTAAIGAGIIAGATRASEQNPVRRLLSWAPLRAVGLVSYGLYLWHWPVYVVLDPARTGVVGVPLVVLRLAVTAVLATTSYLLLEQPIRRGAGGGSAAWASVRTARAGVAAAAMVAVLIVVTTLGATTAQPVRAAGPAATADPGAVRVYVIGDSVAYGLWFEFQQATDTAITVGGSTQLGCGLMSYPLVVGGQPEPPDPTCAGFDSRWPVELAAIKPRVAVLMLGIGEQFDRQVDGTTVRFHTAAYEQFLDRELDRRVAVLGAGGRPVVLLTVPCHRVLESGVNEIPVVINDDGRVDWLNSVQRRYAAAHATTVTLLDLHGLVCAHGYTDRLPGVRTLHTDGLHFSPAGVQAVWRWLGPQLVRIADTARRP